MADKNHHPIPPRADEGDMLRAEMETRRHPDDPGTDPDMPQHPDTVTPGMAPGMAPVTDHEAPDRQTAFGTAGRDGAPGVVPPPGHAAPPTRKPVLSTGAWLAIGAVVLVLIVLLV
ncbi:hypothetical protein [Paracoccus sp. NSM]|uniref:hypothetical protein n=1 Tax=Paracoccus sp. NSM TaxID=3457784 RepID=UPI0040355E6F